MASTVPAQQSSNPPNTGVVLPTTSTGSSSSQTGPTPVPASAQQSQPNSQPFVSTSYHPLPANAHGLSQSWFKFRSERAQWLSVIGIITAVIFGVVGMVYAVDTYRLARWTSEKDYQAYCMSLLAASTKLPADCVPIVHAVLPPPPEHTKDFFLVILNTMRRAPNGKPSSLDGDLDIPPPIITAIMVLTLIITIVTVIYYDDPAASEDPEPVPTPTKTLWISLGLRLSSRLSCLIFLEPEQRRRLYPYGMIPWIAGHAWALYGTRDLPAIMKGSTVLECWFTWGSINTFFANLNNMNRHTIIALWVLLMSFVMGEAVPTGLLADKLRDRQTSWRPLLLYYVWRCAQGLQAVGGALFLLDSIRGCWVFGFLGFWMDWGEFVQPWAILLISPLALLDVAALILMCWRSKRNLRDLRHTTSSL